MVKDAAFVSVWDDGILIETDCKVDTDTGRVFDIEMMEVAGLEVLEEEYVVFGGEEYPIIEAMDDDYGVSYQLERE